MDRMIADLNTELYNKLFGYWEKTPEVGRSFHEYIFTVLKDWINVPCRK